MADEVKTFGDTRRMIINTIEELRRGGCPPLLAWPSPLT